ncbi:MAG: transporter substrate-binding protein [Chloroflexi bacterium]|nr:transporter substrate-binding protein [Chloroflexota bacterium]
MKAGPILGSALLLLSLGATLAPTPAARAATSITFWVRSSEASTAQPLVKAYNATHATQVVLNLIPDAQFAQKFSIAKAGGTVPDAAAVDLVTMPTYAAAGQMMDITSWAHSLPHFAQLSPSHVRMSTYKGVLYGVPFDAESSILLYNKGIFQRAGLNPNQPPTNWAQMEADARKITALGNGIKGIYFSGSCASCNAFEFTPLIWADGGDVLNADGTKATLTSPAVKDALSFYHRMWAEGLMPAGAQTDTGANFVGGFTTGKVGMVALGQFAIGLTAYLAPKIQVGVGYLPGKTGGWSSFAGGNVIGIPAGSAHVQEAKAFIAWILSTGTQTKLFAQAGHIPVRTDLAANVYSKNDPRYLVANLALTRGRNPYSLHYAALFNDPNGPWGALIHQAVFGGNIDQAIATAQQSFTKIINS